MRQQHPQPRANGPSFRWPPPFRSRAITSLGGRDVLSGGSGRECNHASCIRRGKTHTIRTAKARPSSHHRRRNGGTWSAWQRLRGRDPADDGTSIISDRQIARRVAAMAKLAGSWRAGGFSGHSGRVGMAVRMTRNGAPAAAVMRQGRWETTRMISRYTRNETAAEALRYL